MTWHTKLEHRFIERIPRALEPGVLYISMEYATAAHSCACGCDEEVMTPFTPTDWKMVFDGETVSLWPSVGNWQLACRSHYIIEKGQIIRAGSWSQQQVAAERERDMVAKARYYGTTSLAAPASSKPPGHVPPNVQGPETLPKTRLPGSSRRTQQGLWSSILNILNRR